MQAQTPARPRFRQDLVAELVEDGGQRFIDVGDPDTGHMFRFYEVEYSLACAMDGERDVAGIVRWAQEELGLTPSPNEVQTVISTLADLRFIDTGDVAADAQVAKAAPTQPATKAPSQPTAKAADPDLAPGVVVGPAAAKPAPSGADFELGHMTPAAAAAKGSAELPKAPDLALGAPGATPVAAPPKAPVEDIPLGASGASAASTPSRPSKPAPQSEVSIDLSAHMNVRPDDVKEAVRQSRVMSAVEMPKDLTEAEAPKATEKQPVAAKQPEPKAADKAPAKAPEKQPEPVAEKAAAKQPEPKAEKPAEKAPDKVAAKAAEPVKTPEKAKPAEKAADKAKPADKAADKKSDKAGEKSSKPAVELSKQPEAKKPIAPPAPRQGPSMALVILLILVIAGAGAFFVWKFVLNKPEEGASTSSELPPPRPPPPPPPAEALAKIALETQTPQEVKAPAAGTIETIEAADKDVKTGDVIAKLAGGKPLETEIAKLTADIEKLQPAVDTAQKELADAQQVENNQKGVDAAQAKLDKAKKPLDDKKATLEKKQAELDKLTIKSTADGKLAEPVAAGAKVTADQVVAKVQRETLYTATFAIPANTKIAQDGTISVTAGDKTIVCTVIDAQTTSLRVKCPSEGLAEGADLKLTLPR